VTVPAYKLKVWGARGTVPTPHPDQLRFGGHTSCLAAELADPDYVILDCGSGLRLLGEELARARTGRPTRFHVFLSHYHLDHVEGLPYFRPLYDPDNAFVFYGFESEGRTVQQILETLMAPPYFPVRLANVPANVEYITTDGRSFALGDVTVSCLPLTHPDGSLSYRLEHGGRRIVFATDHEHGNEVTDRALIEFSKGVDYLIYDATYLRAEYESLRKGWGHSTWYAAVQTALSAKVKTLVLFHHHPNYTDEELEEVLQVARQEFPNTEIATEGVALPF